MPDVLTDLFMPVLMSDKDFGKAGNYMSGLRSIFSSSLRVWHNVQNLDMMFSDFVGTPAVVGSSVALQLDSAQGERRTSLGPELIVNGGFDADTDWTKGTGWTISGGVATRTNTGSVTDLYESGIITANRLYKIVITVSAYTSGNLSVRIGGVAAIVGSNITATGTYTFYGWGEPSDTRFNLRGDTTFAGSIDSVSCREVITVTEQARGSEFRQNGTPTLTGAATVATYNTSTGQGTATRVDGSNLSYVVFTGATTGRPYFVDVENTGSASLNVQDGSTLIASLTAGQRRTVFVPALVGLPRISATTNATSIAFTVHSVKECLGTPRYQSTSAQRPILGRHPKGGRRNLVLHTENLTSGWGGATTKTIAAETYNGSPFTTVTKTTAILEEAAAQAVGVLTGGQPYTITCAFLAGTVTACQLGIHNPTDVWGASSVAVEVIEGPGAAGFSGSLFTLSGLSSTVPTVVRLTFTKATTASSTINLYPQSSGSTTIGHSVKVTRFQLETGSVATPYQKVTTQYDCTEAGVPDCYYLQADGSDDGMVTPALNLSGTDKVAVFTAARKLSDAATGIIAELSADLNANAGSFYLAHSINSSGVRSYSAVSRGSLLGIAHMADNALPAPHTAILTGLFDISGDSTILRVNGTQTASASPNHGTGNFGNYPLYFGRRGGSSLPFNGLEYGNFIVAGTLSDAQTSAAETYQNNFVGAY